MDREQMETLFRTYGNDVYRLAYSWLGNRHDAEDICQTVFLKLSDQKIELWPGKEKPWLLTTTANACKNHLKSFWRKNIGELDESIPFEGRRDREVHDAVMALPPKYRAVIHLYYFEGYDQGEIGDILRISRTAVQTRMSRARAMLKKELSVDEKRISKDDGANQPV